MANEYDRKMIRKYMRNDERGDKEVEEKQYPGIVTVPYDGVCSRNFGTVYEISFKTPFRTAFKSKKM